MGDPDPDNFLRVCVHLLLPGWHDAVLAAVARSDVQTERLAHYAAAERILADAAVLVPLLHPRQVVVLEPCTGCCGVEHPNAGKDVTVVRRA